MKFECEKCVYKSDHRTEIRQHVRKEHGDTLGERKGGNLPIKRIPSYPGEAAYAPAPTISIAAQMAKKMAESAQRMQEWMARR